MTEEEKEAIEYFKKREQICMENADICDENNFDEEATCLRKEHMIIETLLNLIEKKDKRINELEKESTDDVIKYRQEIDKRNKKIIEMSDCIERQHKIIDGMARSIANYDSQLVINRFKDKEHVKEFYKEYFEKKEE